MANITKRFVDSLSPGLKDQVYWDDALKGFGIKVTPAWRKVYILQYRTGGRGMPVKRLTLDIHGRITADQARKAASLALYERAQGIDPVEKKQQARKKPENTFASVFEMFKAKHLSTLRSGDEVGRAMERVLMHRWGKIDVAAIRKAQIIEAVEKVADGGSKYAANRVLAYIHKFFNWCLARDLVLFNPAAGIEKPMAPVERDRVLTDDEIRLLWRVWKGMAYPFGFFYQVLLLTAQRRDEVASMRWTDLALKRAFGQSRAK
jgi:hypothetical protein